MKSKIITLLLTLWVPLVFGQIITTVPVFPSDDQAVQVTFNAQEGNGGLAGYTGDVYAHTGVITNLSTGPSDWKHVKTDWGENTPETKLERIGTDLYRFTTSGQTIREYYGVPASEQILQLAFVFRSGVKVGDSYKEGKTETNGDIFAPVYAEGLFVVLNQPVNFANLVQPGESVIIDATANSADSLILFIDNNRVTSSASNTLYYSHTAAQSGKHYIKVQTMYNGESAYDSAYYFVQTDVAIAALPENARDGINYTGDSSVLLVLYAPGKQNVFVLGDFNNWEYSTEGYMNKTPDGSRFWKEITGLTPQKEYVYQYKVDNEILIADPYADKYLDPWNDRYIPAITYPGLIPYPSDKTSEYASVFQTAQTPFNWSISSFERPQKTDLVIYELLVRDFIARHDYQTLIDTLTYLKMLGVNAIELMPVYEFEGNSSWGYNTAFHFAPDKYYGTKNDLKEFIDVCHQQGIAVILDIVLNHVFGSSPFARLYWDNVNGRPASNNPWLNPVPKHDFNVGYDFNHESQATKDLVQRVVEYWITEYKVDGYRFDLSKGFTQKNTLNNTNAWGQYDASRIAIWKGIANKIWAVDPEAYVILEHFAENSEEKELANYGMMLWGNMNGPFRQMAMGWAENSNIAWTSYKSRGWNDPNVVGYMESHDEERMMYSIYKWADTSNKVNYNPKPLENAVKRLAAAAAVFYSIPGPKMLWQFGEVGYDYSIDYNTRVGEKPIRWDYTTEWRREYLYKTTAALIRLKKELPVFETTDFTIGETGLIKRINLRSDDMSVTVVANLNIEEEEFIAGFNATGKWYDYFTGDSITVASLDETVVLPPGEFKLYTTRKLDTPETGLAVPEKTERNNIILGGIFPNPASTTIEIPLDVKDSGNITLEVFSSTGKLVRTLYNRNLSAGRHLLSSNIEELSDGVYYLRLVTAKKVETARFVIVKH